MEEYNESQTVQTIFEKSHRIPRATQRFLGIIARQRGERTPVAKVRIEPDAWSFLMTMLERVGTNRSGPLFGDQLGETVTVTDAAHKGYDQMSLSQTSLSFYQMDPSYMLGWSDCLSNYGENDVDWVGQWVMLPNNFVITEFGAYDWVEAAAQRGLVSDQHFLIFIGLAGEQVKARAYVWVRGEVVEVDLHVA